MMFMPELANYENKKAAGILSRMILDIESAGLNPAGMPIDEQERILRSSILARVKDHVRQQENPSNIGEFEERVVDVLNQEASERSDPIDNRPDLEKLARDGVLPTDVLSVRYHEGVESFLVAKTEIDDKLLVERTLKKPDISTINPEYDGFVLKGVQAHGRYFNFGNDKDKFLFVIVGRVKGISLTVNYFVRIYDQDIVLFGISSPIEALARFADRYSSQITISNWTGNFQKFMFVKLLQRHELVKNSRHTHFVQVTGGWLKVQLNRKASDSRTVIGTLIYAEEGEPPYVALAMSINIQKYKHDVERHMRREKLVFDLSASRLVIPIIK